MAALIKKLKRFSIIRGFTKRRLALLELWALLDVLSWTLQTSSQVDDGQLAWG